MLSQLIAKVSRDFPDHQVVRHFEALLKIYRLAVHVTVLERHQLPIIARYILRSVVVGVRTPQQIARTLGLDEDDLAQSGAILLSAGLVRYGDVSASGQRELVLTREGESFLAGETEVTRPKRGIVYLQFNPLTRAVTADRRGALSPREARDSGLPVISGNTARPSLGDLSLGNVREALDTEAKGRNREILELVSLEQPKVAYLSDIQVFVLRHSKGSRERLAAFRGFDYLPDESSVLERLRSEGHEVVPDDAAVLEPAAWDVHGVLTSDAAEVVQRRLEAQRGMRDLELRLATHERTVTQPGSGSETSAVTIEELRRALAEKQAELDASQSQADQANLAFLRTEEHRAWLERAFTDAQEEVMIISPWMNVRAFDEPLMDLVAQAVDRGIRVYIGYGFGSDKTEDAERHRNNVMTVKKRLRDRVGDSPLLQLRDLRATHQKILVCDSQFAVAGSFNWLSYRGDKDSGYRMETSVLLKSPAGVGELAQLAKQTLGLVS